MLELVISVVAALVLVWLLLVAALLVARPQGPMLPLMSKYEHELAALEGP